MPVSLIPLYQSDNAIQNWNVVRKNEFERMNVLCSWYITDDEIEKNVQKECNAINKYYETGSVDELYLYVCYENPIITDQELIIEGHTIILRHDRFPRCCIYQLKSQKKKRQKELEEKYKNI